MSQANVDTNRNNSSSNTVTLTQMRAGQKGKIVKIDGGHGLAQKLDALGIRVGKEVTKISAQLMRGPVLLRQDNTRVALGFGMASKVSVDLKARHRK